MLVRNVRSKEKEWDCILLECLVMWKQVYSLSELN